MLAVTFGTRAFLKVLFTEASKGKRYLNINLVRYAHGLYGENYEAVMPGSKEPVKWRHSVCEGEDSTSERGQFFSLLKSVTETQHGVLVYVDEL